MLVRSFCEGLNLLIGPDLAVKQPKKNREPWTGEIFNRNDSLPPLIETLFFVVHKGTQGSNFFYSQEELTSENQYSYTFFPSFFTFFLGHSSLSSLRTRYLDKHETTQYVTLATTW